ncbi:hypothetical protein HUU58_14015 [bacterium]|nr:hypothetical protein [bacterium]
MAEQNYVNHKQYRPLYHGLTFVLILVIGALSIHKFVSAYRENSDWMPALLFVLIWIVLVFIFFYARIFALRAQDRAIRAEENFRHFILTGKRFSSDSEFPELARKAAEENMDSDTIKKSIQNWRADHLRA